jgi:hypothetical protein
MREVATGVWHWKAAHPEWKPGQTWDRMVSSYAVDTGEHVLLLTRGAGASAVPLTARRRQAWNAAPCELHGTPPVTVAFEGSRSGGYVERLQRNRAVECDDGTPREDLASPDG